MNIHEEGKELNKMTKCNLVGRKCDHPVVCDFIQKCRYTEMGAIQEQVQITATEKYRIPEFIEFLEQSKIIHLKKNQDYANESNPFSNFERSAELISWFNNSIDVSFIALIGTKLARIAELRDGRIPNNESLDDSFLDLLTYVGLWAAYIKRQSNNTDIY